ncbi:ABC-type Fe3+-hydroxamate transport system, periplasmic component [Fulvivirga imtechensis AK7]|uniref:ABC-type Fe3+-hydroxamate transport system, periplasmic component n=1 Tax=Fulvivirga imtechensis AK7 TaxID=1237149 RepID=L8JYH6_9BACT|nr:helical backbone metal receptor [Fulvivirga imtechensis]ELR72699.1 ABC-type Fe3+-hydroxamate transport system, periplasmic component [Fulvivirga imtechensis AK7]
MQSVSRTTYDQMGFEVIVPRNPRIISLVPSQTELLFDLGLDDQITGVTKFCIHPADRVKQKPIIGGTKKFRFDVIDELRPDLIIGNKEENYQEGITQLKSRYPVWMSDIVSLREATEMIRSIGNITDVEAKANQLADDILGSFENIKRHDSKRTLYFIWQNPYMVAGNGTFINEMLQRIGLINAAVHLERYPELRISQIGELDPELILLSSEPYPFKEKHIETFMDLCPNANVQVVDGEMFSWYGSRLLGAVDYFNSLKL